MISTGLNASVVLPCYWGVKTQEPQGVETERLRVLLSNVYTANTHSELLIELVQAENPDIVVLEEVNDRWINELQKLNVRLPYSKWISRSDNFGIGIWSRLPFSEVKVIEFGDYSVPSIEAEVEFAGQKLSILATHPVPPVSVGGFAERNAQLVDLAGLARQSVLPMILVGDLNVTMWSPYYRRVILESGLKDARKGFGVLPTWPTLLPFMKIPLDQCLVSPSIHVRGFKTGTSVGSDHLPIIVDLTFDFKK